MKKVLATIFIMMAAFSGQVMAEGAVLDRDAYYALDANANKAFQPEFSVDIPEE